MTKFVDRTKHLQGSDAPAEGSKPSTASKKGIKVAARAGNTAADDDATNEQLVYNVGGGSMVVVASDRPEPDQESDATKLRHNIPRQDTQHNLQVSKKSNVNTFQTYENELSQIGGGRPGSNQPVLIAGQVRVVEGRACDYTILSPYARPHLAPAFTNSNIYSRAYKQGTMTAAQVRNSMSSPSVSSVPLHRSYHRTASRIS